MQEQSSSTMMPTVSAGLSITEGVEVSLNAIASDADDDTITYIVIPPSTVSLSGRKALAASKGLHPQGASRPASHIPR